jgi:hypothetical protein
MADGKLQRLRVTDHAGTGCVADRSSEGASLGLLPCGLEGGFHVHRVSVVEAEGLGLIALEGEDPAGLAAFWAGFLDGEVAPIGDDLPVRLEPGVTG